MAAVTTCRDHAEATLLSNAIFSSSFDGRDIGLDRRAIVQKVEAARKGLVPTISKSNKKPKTNDDAASSLILQLPPELLRKVGSFMDIPTLGNLAQVHQQGSLRDYACGQVAWGPLVQDRFLINTQTKRPKSHGGKDWKDAYRTMHACHKLPKCRLTNRKIIFAKPQHKSTTSIKTSSSNVAMWVLLNHREDCKTRTIPSSSNRYLDFWVCLQNTRSNGASVKVNVLQSELQLLSHHREAYTESCLQEDDGFHWIMPRLIHKHSSNNSNNNNNNNRSNSVDSMMTTDDDDDQDKWDVSTDLSKGIELKPFEFCIVSIPFECGQDVFETDFLARTWAMKVPFTTINASTPTTTSNSSDTPTAMDLEEVESESEVPMTTTNKPEEEETTAWFISEQEIWNNYSELPGGCLTLSDRDRRMHL